MFVCAFGGYIVLAILSSYWKCVSASEGNLQEICMGEHFQAECPDGHVVKVVSALFGRMHIGRCARQGNIGCVADAVGYLDMKCSGRQHCDFLTPENLYVLNTCSTDAQPYLEAVYECISVISEVNLLSQCQRSGFIELSRITEGNIASSVAQHIRQGTRLCPWMISAEQGQRINITLLDFGTHTAEVIGATCDIYATITERTSTSPTMICSGDDRERIVYLSSSYHIEIQFIDASEAEVDSQFILQFSVTGCQDPPLKGNTLKQRTFHKAVLHCKATGRDQNIYCRGASWNTHVEQCVDSAWNIFSNGWQSRQGIWIVLGIGIAIGIVIGLGLLFCGIMCFKRYKSNGGTVTRDNPYDVDMQGRNAKFYVMKKDDTPYGEMNYATYDRGANTLQKHYMPAVNPVNPDVMLIETTGTLKYQSVPSKTKNHVTIRYMDQEEPAYEKPI